MFSSPDDPGEIVSNGAGLLGLLGMLVSIANIVWTWHTRSQSAAADRVTKIETRLDVIEDKQITVEEQMKHLPTKEDIAGLRIQLADTLGLIGRQGAEITSMSHAVNRIDNYLMREKA